MSKSEKIEMVKLDSVLWDKHMAEKSPALTSYCQSHPEGVNFNLVINGESMEFTRMSQGKNAGPTPGYKATGNKVYNLVPLKTPITIEIPAEG